MVGRDDPDRVVVGPPGPAGPLDAAAGTLGRRSGLPAVVPVREKP